MTELLTPKKLSRCLCNSTTRIGQYHIKAERLLLLNCLWKQQVHIPLRLHSTIANFKETSVTLAVENSGWASQLHYEKRGLLNLFNTWPGLSKLTKITGYVEVVPPQVLQTITPNKTIQLSKANQQLLRSVASTLSQAGLRAALMKLADRRANH